MRTKLLKMDLSNISKEPIVGVIVGLSKILTNKCRSYVTYNTPLLHEGNEV